MIVRTERMPGFKALLQSIREGEIEEHKVIGMGIVNRKRFEEQTFSVAKMLWWVYFILLTFVCYVAWALLIAVVKIIGAVIAFIWAAL